MKQNLSTFTLLLLLVPSRAVAMPPEYQVNVREGCRQAVAGAFLKAYDDKVRLTQYQETLKEQLKTVGLALSTAVTKAKAADAAAAAAAYDAQLAAVQADTATVVKTLRAQLDDYGQMLKSNGEKISSAVKTEQALRKQIDPLFTYVTTGDFKDGGYPDKIAYRSPCPQYRALCPLPLKDREGLAGLRIDGALPEACQRYLSLSRVR